MPRYLLLIALGLCLCAGIVRAEEDAAEQLLARLAAVQHVQGSFSQRQYDPDGELVAESSGTFRLLRPGYFAWDILAPDSQIVIASPEYLWHYDRDLETVTRRPVAGREELSPLQVLGGDTDILRERFTVTALGPDRYELVPAMGDPGFRELRLTLEGELVTAMEILDSLEQRIVIDLEDLDTGVPLAPEDFAFAPPEGVDLFYHDE